MGRVNASRSGPRSSRKQKRHVEGRRRRLRDRKPRREREGPTIPGAVVNLGLESPGQLPKRSDARNALAIVVPGMTARGPNEAGQGGIR